MLRKCMGSSSLFGGYRSIFVCSTGHSFIARSSSSQQRSQFDIFDRTAKLKQRNYTLTLPDHNVYDYLKNDFGYRLFDNMLDIKRCVVF